MHQATTVQEADLAEAKATDFDEVYIANRADQSTSEVAAKIRLAVDKNRNASRTPFLAKRLVVMVEDVDGDAAKARIRKALDLSEENGWDCA